VSKTRVYELAKRLKISTKELMDELEELGIPTKSHMSVLDDETVNIILGLHEVETEEEKSTVKTKKKAKHKKEKEKEEAEEEEKKAKRKEKAEEKEIEKKKIFVKPEELKLNILASKMKIPVAKIIKDYFSKGIVLRPPQTLSLEEAKKVAAEYNCELELQRGEIIDPVEALKKKFEKLYQDEKNLVQRPPVVTVMGHVDHGKTTLLDHLRKTKVAESEAGGITQSVGAYQIPVNNKLITFIDTPGHEAFTEMRARGAQATDIVILVVAADDGVMPQTVEAFDHAKTANVPIVVAINKIDKPNSNIEMTKQQLASKLGLVPEDWGGDTITVPISALNGQGIDELLEMVLLVAEMNEIRCVPEGPARGVIVESRLDKAVGPLANAIVKDGILKRGDYLVAGSTLGKVKALIDETGKRVKEAKPSEPIQILGFDEVPDVHEIMYVVETLDQAREVKESAEKKESKESMIKGKKGVKLEEFAKTSEGEETKTLNLIIKADSFGTVEALKQSVARLETEEVHIEVIHSGIGSINSSDVMLAAASNAVILGFNVKPNSEARKDAEVEDVQIRTYDIIFELIDDLKKALEGLLEPEEVDETTGHGEVKEVFRIKKVGYIAGVQMIDGHVQKKGEVRVYRNGEEIHDGPIETLKHYKDDVSRIEAPKECGIKLEGFEDIEKGDELEFHIKKQVRRTLDFNENQ